MKHNKKEKGVVGKIWDIAVKKTRRLYVIQMMYIIAVVLILKPFYTFIISKLLRQKGYLTTELMIPFFTDPFVIMVLLCLLFFMCIAYGGGYIFSYQYINEVRQKEKRKGYAILQMTVNGFIKGMREQPVRFVLMLMGSVIVQNIPVTVLACRYIPAIHYMVDNLLKQKYVKEILFGVVVILLLCFFRNYFTIGYMFFEKNTFREAKEKSRALWKQKHWRAIGCWLLGNFFITVFIVLFYFYMRM